MRWPIVWIVLLAVVVRLPLLTSGWLDDDELYSARDAIALFREDPPDSVKRYPLSFALERLSLEMFGLGPVALRLPSMACGIVAPALLWWVGRGIVGQAAALWAALLLAVWPWHQYFSGAARYYTPLFLAGTAALAAAWGVLLRGSALALVRLVAATAVAMAIHPTGLLAACGALPALHRRIPARVRLALLGVAFACAAGIRLTPYWRPIEKVIVGAAGHGEDALGFIHGLGLNVTPLLTALALVGGLFLWRERRPASVFLLVAVAVPAVGMALVATQGFVQPRYLLAASPAVLLAAGGALQGILRPLRGGVRAATVSACLMPWLPSIASNWIDADRHDVAAVAQSIGPLLAADQPVFAESHNTLRACIFGFHRSLPPGRGEPPYPLAFIELPPLPEHMGAIESRRRRTWFVLSENQFAAPPDRQYAALVGLLRRQGVRRGGFGRTRFDYHNNASLLLTIEPLPVRRKENR